MQNHRDLMIASSSDLSDYNSADDLAHAATLPSRWYTDPAILELEKRKIFWKTWQPVGRLEQVVRPGDHFTADVLGEPIVITRGLDDQLRAFTTFANTVPVPSPPEKAIAKACNTNITAGLMTSRAN